MLASIYQFIIMYKLELIISLLFILLQYMLGQRPTIKNLKKINEIFPSTNEVNTESGVLQIINVEGYDMYNSLCDNINNYIRQNSDSIDINQMKDAVNRLVDNEYEQATSRLSMPMYLGLMGTYIGVAYGLCWLAMSGFDNVDAVTKFVGGVIVAMVTSFFGLGMTTASNYKASEVSDKINGDRDRFIAFLETEILPKMPSTLAQTLKAELQKSIGTFGNTVGVLNTTISTLNSELKSTFEKVTTEFGDNLTRNLSSLETTISMLNSGVSSQANIMMKQDELLTKMSGREFLALLENMVASVDKSALSLSKLDDINNSLVAMQALQNESKEVQISLISAQKDLINQQSLMTQNIVELDDTLRTNAVKYTSQMSQITIDSQQRTNELLSEPRKLFNYIEGVLADFRKIEKFVETVTVEEYRNNDERLKIIASQLNEIKNAGDMVKSYLDSVKTDMENYLDCQKDALKSSVEEFVLSWKRSLLQYNAGEIDSPMSYLKRIENLSIDVENIKRAMEREDLKRLLENITLELGKINDKVGGRVRVEEKRGLFSSIFRKK